RVRTVTGVQTCALPIWRQPARRTGWAAAAVARPADQLPPRIAGRRVRPATGSVRTDAPRPVPRLLGRGTRPFGHSGASRGGRTGGCRRGRHGGGHRREPVR